MQGADVQAATRDVPLMSMRVIACSLLNMKPLSALASCVLPTPAASPAVHTHTHTHTHTHGVRRRDGCGRRTAIEWARTCGPQEQQYAHRAVVLVQSCSSEA